MEQIINTLTQNPLYMVLAVLVAIFILFGMLKKMFKMVLLIIAISVIYIGYMFWTGKEVSVKSFTKDLKSATEKIGEGVGKIKKEGVDKVIEKILDD